MRKMTRQLLGLVLASVMVISQLFGAGVVSASEQSGEGSWVATEYFTNGDFETGDQSGWNINFASWEGGSSYTTKTDSWAQNNTTQFLNVYNGAGTENTLTISQTLPAVPAGTYRVSFGIEGMASEHGLSVSVADVTNELPATTGWDVWAAVTTDAFELTDVTDVTVTVSGNLPAGYWGDFDNFILEQYVASGEETPGTEEVPEEIPDIPETDTTISGEITVEKIAKLPEDFIMGMDISSVMSLFASGVTYKDYEGNTLDNVSDFCEFLASNGITHIRVRVWNNPYDAAGNGYGGGNCDVGTAARIAEGCRAAGIKMLVDFHCSDLWADPGKQQAPKAWSGYSVAEKAVAVEEFIGSALRIIDPNCDTVAMVQVGNETTGGFAGVYDVEDMCALFSAGAKAVRTYNEDVKVVIHVTNPEKGNVTKWAGNLDQYAVDYDVMATSYYPYWHGSLANLESQLKVAKETYGIDIMVAETSYAYTLDDSDGHSNTVRVGNNDSGDNILQPFTVQGQANAVRDVMASVNNVGGLGVFYWEPAWLTVGDIRGLEGEALNAQIEANKVLWEKYGSGWASSYAAEYDAKDAGQWYGGTAVDNEAMFYPDGTPTAALHVWNYVKTGAISKYVSVESITNPEATVKAGEVIAFPETVTVTYNSGAVEEKAVWDEETTIDTAVPGTYTVNGTVTFSKEINSGTYEGKTSAPVVYTVVVKAANLLANAADAGFEDGTNFTIEGSGIKNIPSNEDVYAGNGCLHWYWTSATTGVVTYNKVLSLEAGKYNLAAVTAGMAGEKVTLQILNTEKEVLFAGEAGVTTGWNLWDTVEVNFELAEATEVMFRIVVDIQDGGWGSVDELYLSRLAVAEDKNESSAASGSANGSSDNVANNVAESTAVAVPVVLVASRPAISETEEIIDETEEILVAEEAVTEEPQKETEERSSERVVLEEEVPLVANAEDGIPVWLILVTCTVILAFAGLYIFAKQRKMIK